MANSNSDKEIEFISQERINRELTALHEICATIIQSIDVAEFLQTLIERAGQILQVRSGSIVMLDSDGYLRIKAYFGFKEEHARAYVLAPNEGRGWRIFSSRQAQIFVTEQDKERMNFHRITWQENIQHTIGAPMIGSSGQVMGVLFLNDKQSQEPFDSRDLKLLESFANLAAIAVEKQIQLEELNRQKESYRQLSERLEASLNELNALNERLQDSNKLKDEVLSICAHDVRSPLTSIISYAELLLSSSNLSDKQQRYINHIHRSSEKINNLVQNLLVRARYLETDEPLCLEALSIGQLAQDAIQQVEDRLSNRKIHVSIYDRASGLRIRADRFKLVQVFDNLIDNAVKFTPEEGSISIEIERDSEGDNILVTIANTGEGIPDSALPRLFVRYFQASIGFQRGGYGLGLAICKQNVELHNGSISVESIANERTLFKIRLPFGQPYLVSLSDDSNFDAKIALQLPENWRSCSYNHVKDLLDSLMKELPNLLLVDTHFAETSLESLVSQLRREYTRSRLPIVVIGSPGNIGDYLSAEIDVWESANISELLTRFK